MVSKKKVEKRPVYFHLDPADYQRFKVEVAREGKTAAVVLRQLIAEWVRGRRNPPVDSNA